MPLQLNDGLFRANGGCGYVLKPAHLRRGLHKAEEDKWDPKASNPSVAVARITLLWGEMLPSPSVCGDLEPCLADEAVDFHPDAQHGALDGPRSAAAVETEMLATESLRPYVTVEVIAVGCELNSPTDCPRRRGFELGILSGAPVIAHMLAP